MDGYVRLEVFNVLGQQVVTLVDGEQAAGAYTVSWDARDASGYGVAAGVYIYRLTAGRASATRRMVLVDGPAGTAAAATRRLTVVGPTDAAEQSYGLTVSGVGIAIYVDAAFEVGRGPVELVVEPGEGVGAGKAATGVHEAADLNADGVIDIVDALIEATYSQSPGTSFGPRAPPPLVVQSVSLPRIGGARGHLEGREPSLVTDRLGRYRLY